MAILDQLGLNSSFFFQFVIFAVAYFVLSRVVFVPYARALHERELKTKGGEDLAVEIQKKSEELTVLYESKARQVSGSVKAIFDDYRQQASAEYDKIVSQARTEAQTVIEEARQKVNSEINEAQIRVQAEIPLVAQEMTQRLLAK